MIKLIQEIDTSGPVTELSRLYYTIYAYDDKQDLAQIDLKHQLITRNKLTYPPRSVKCFNWLGKNSYFVVTLNRIEKWGGPIVSESNSKAEFTGPIDCHGGALLFAKYHCNYKKYSINHLWQGTKKIVKLTDQPIRKLLFNPSNTQVIYCLKDTVSCFDLQDPQKETLLFKKSNCLFDGYNLYFLGINLENKAKEKYECGIFDFRNGKLSDSWTSDQPPVKIESFSRSLLVASSNKIEFFDIRKLIKPFEYERVKGIRDFLYEPNIDKLFLGTQTNLRVYSIQN